MNDLYKILMDKDFTEEKLVDELESGRFGKEDINLAAYEYVDSCFGDTFDDDENVSDYVFGTVVPGLPSSHLVEAIRILLQHGLDPNLIHCEYYSSGMKEESNIMEQLKYVDNGYIAADALALMLEAGGNPSIILNGVSLIRDINFDILFDIINQENRARFDARMHYWMVLVGYGATLEKGEPVIYPCGDFDIRGLKNHRQYYYGGISSDRSNDGMEICIFDRESNWEAARF